MVTRTYRIPDGFTWSHIADAYVNKDGWRWDSKTNIMYNADGNPVKSTSESISDPTARALNAAGVVGVDGTTREETVEEEIARKGLTAPRITPADVDAAILAEQFMQPTGTLLTVCVLTLQNGFTVTGESACASPENFNAEIGKRIARDDAKRKIWALLGYTLRDKLVKGDST